MFFGFFSPVIPRLLLFPLTTFLLFIFVVLRVASIGFLVFSLVGTIFLFVSPASVPVIFSPFIMLFRKIAFIFLGNAAVHDVVARDELRLDLLDNLPLSHRIVGDGPQVHQAGFLSPCEPSLWNPVKPSVQICIARHGGFRVRNEPCELRCLVRNRLERLQ